MRVAIIGGGAAGFFSAINVKNNHPNSSVTIFEKSNKTLSKVKISGGGRCNVTSGCFSINELCKAYPRGGKQLKKAFHIFNTKDTFDWFENRGVPLYVQEDLRVFPKSNSSSSIIACLEKEIYKLKIEIVLDSPIIAIKEKNELLELTIKSEQKKELYSHVIIASGGSPKIEGLKWLERLNHEIIPPVPSLFTFNMPNEQITKLMGISLKNVIVKIEGTKLKSSGPLLITHWGMSGPAILKLSSLGARSLNELEYNFKIQLNWVNQTNNSIVEKALKECALKNPNKKVSSTKFNYIPERLWIYLINKSEISNSKKWNELGKKSINKLINQLTNDIYSIKGKTTFKEEFVTCGGVSLESIDLKTMQSKSIKNLYFAGEVLDIDAITGGYNFQAAWTTGYIAGKLN
ncbi:MAG: NAD(P)/FAD-dependent oxidoreductase [Flavobacteriales bacterium]|nr:NAD(P)/FAD-dependent oxidoreductase [Flavobacteriales bacterium]